MPGPFQQLRFRDVPEMPRKPHPYFSTPAREVEVDSRPFGRIRVHLRELGDGPPLLLVHGLMTTGYSWRYVLEPLAREYRVIVPDLPGAGRSAMPVDKSFHPDALADFLVELVDALGIRGADVVGNSMGGYLCMRAALRHPGAFKRLINVHSPAKPELRLHALRGLLGVPGTTGLLRALVAVNPLRWAHMNVHYYDETLKSLEEAREYSAPLTTRDGLVCFRKFLAETMAPGPMGEFLDALRKTAFPTPLMLLYSRTDPLVRPENGELLASLVPAAKLAWMEHTSHFAHVDTPELVIEHIRAFMPADERTERRIA